MWSWAHDIWIMFRYKCLCLYVRLLVVFRCARAMVYVTVSAVQRARYGYGALCLIISAQVATDVIYQYASSMVGVNISVLGIHGGLSVRARAM